MLTPVKPCVPWAGGLTERAAIGSSPAAAAYYPTMSDAELVDIVFPTSRRTKVGNLLGEARQVLKNLERAGELRVLEDKVLPPLNPPPRHG